MFPYTTADFRQAAETAGMTILREEWVAEDGTCGCPLTVLAVAKGGQAVLAEIIHSSKDEVYSQTCKRVGRILGLDPGVVDAFAMGYDGVVSFACKAFESDDKKEAFETGQKVRGELSPVDEDE